MPARQAKLSRPVVLAQAARREALSKAVQSKAVAHRADNMGGVRAPRSGWTRQSVRPGVRTCYSGMGQRDLPPVWPEAAFREVGSSRGGPKRRLVNRVRGAPPSPKVAPIVRASLCDSLPESAMSRRACSPGEKCSRRRSGRKTASSTSSPTRPRTCSTKVRFISRFYGEGEQTRADEVDAGRRGRAVHRARSSAPTRPSSASCREPKVARDRELLRDGGEPAADPRHRAAVHRRAAALRAGRSRSTNVGNLEEPAEQVPDHRRPAPAGGAALLPQAAPRRRARPSTCPCVIFDGKSEDFADRDVRHHQLDADAHQQEPPRRPLREASRGRRPTRSSPRRSSSSLYSEGDSPLRYKINRLGGRSKQEKWILQAELFNELHRWVVERLEPTSRSASPEREVERFYGVVRDFFKAAEKVWGDAWGNADVHGHAAGDAQGDDPRVRRSRRTRRRAGEGRVARWAYASSRRGATW